jgi:peptide/nickel transport system substrate-binding protein
LVKQILSGAGTPAQSLLGSPTVFGYAPVEQWSYDPARARTLVKEAGADGAAVVMWAPKAAYPQSADVAQYVQRQLEAIGLRVSLNIWGDQPAYQKAPETSQRYNLYMLGWGNGTRDAEGTLRALFHSSLVGKPFNRSRYANPAVDQLLDQAAAEPDRAKRAEYYRQLQETLYRDATHGSLYTQKTYFATRKAVTGIISDDNEHIFFWNAAKAE